MVIFKQTIMENVMEKCYPKHDIIRETRLDRYLLNVQDPRTNSRIIPISAKSSNEHIHL